MSKYHSKKAFSADGKLHDSKKEARRWEQLQLMERAGKIKDLKRQVEFELIPAQYESYPRYGKKGQRIKDGRRCVERSCRYVADFVYSAEGALIVEDCKGMRTHDYVIKRKLMLKVFGIKITET